MTTSYGEAPPWRILRNTRCGIEAFNRPCQNVTAGVALPGAPCPQNDLCRAPGETVYLIDDDPATLSELRELVEWFGYRVECYETATEFQRVIGRTPRGCVLLDVELPGIGGLEAHQWIRSTFPALPVVFLSGVSTIQTAVSCMREGAVGFLVKPVVASELRHALMTAVSSSRMNHCRQESVELICQRTRSLTPAEWRVARLVAQGYLTKQIAAILDRSENTTKIHRLRIYRKLGVSSSAQLLRILDIAGLAKVQETEQAA